MPPAGKGHTTTENFENLIQVKSPAHGTWHMAHWHRATVLAYDSGMSTFDCC